MNTKFLSIALITSVITIKAQQIQNRPASAFNKIETSGSVNVIYTNSDSLSLSVSAAAKEIEKVETKYEGSTLIVSNKGNFTMPVNVYVKNNTLVDVQSSGASSFRTTNLIKPDSLSINVSGSSDVNIKTEGRSIKTIQSGAGELKLSGSAVNLFSELSGASSLKAYDLTVDKANVSTTGASVAKLFVNDKLFANASGASSIKIKGNAKDISAEATTAASITKIDEQTKKVVGKSGKDSTIYTWKGKRIIIIDKEDDDDTTSSKHKHSKYGYSNEDFRHWSGFSMGVTGYVGKDNSINMPKATNYMDLDYSRSFNFQFNLAERHLNIVKHKVKLVTGFGFDYHSYAFNRNTNLNADPQPNFSFTSDSLRAFATVDTSNAYGYRKNKFRTTYIQIPLLLEFNTSNNPNKSFHIAFGVIGQYLISSRTKQYLEQDNFRFTKSRKDSYDLSPFSAKAHVNLGYKGVTVFGEYSLTPLFQSGKGPELYSFAVGVRLVPFD
ncbi:MAG: DUF2807 domain-containing protein [Bacteroidia bacterium]|nr:DUF2807 domain-containing protein [Bacteroidia bacterium]